MVLRSLSDMFSNLSERVRLDIAQTDVFHQFLLVSCDSESRSSSFCYQIVVRETENRQQRGTIFISIPRGASRENGAPVPAAPGRAPPPEQIQLEENKASRLQLLGSGI